MIEQSAVYRLFTSGWQVFLRFYDNSVIARIVNAIISRIMLVWDGSIIKWMLFSDRHYDEKLQKSVVGRIMNKLAFLEKISINGREVVKNSILLSRLSPVFNNLLFLSVRAYGLTLILFGCTVSALMLLNAQSGLLLYGGGASVVIGFIFVFINRSLAEIYNGSIFLRWFGGLFGLFEIEEKVCEKNNCLFFATLGVVLGLLGGLLDMTTFIMAAGGLIGGTLVLYRPEIGVFTAAFLLPLVPTKIILGLTAITIVSYVIHVCITGRLKLKFTMLDLFVILFGILLAYSVFISYKPAGSFPVAAVYILYIAFYIAVKNTICTKKQLFAIISLVVLSGFIVSCIGIVQKITGAFESREMWLDTEMFGEAGARVYSTLENPNVLGEYLLFIIPLAFAMLYYYKKPLYKCAVLGVLAVSAYCMILTLSRGAWLGLIFAFAVFIMISDRKLLWIAVIGLILAPVIMPQSIIERFLSIGNIQDTSTNYRVNIWLASLLMLKVFWPVGVGLGMPSFVFIYSRFAFNAVYAPHSHNLFLQIIIDLGIFGILLFIGYMSVFFKNLLVSQKMTKDSFLKITAGALCAGMAGFLLQGMTDNVWYNYRIVAFFWLIMALSGTIKAVSPVVCEEDKRIEEAKK